MPRINPEEDQEAIKLARFIHGLLSEDDEALVMGAAENLFTLIDGHFDLMKISQEIIRFVHTKR